MNIFLCILLSGFITAVGTTNALAYFKTGNELSVWCAAEESDPDYTTLQAFCTAYVQGVADTIETSLTEGRTERTRCVPDGSTAEQLVEIVMDYQARNLPTRHLSASDSTVAALTQAFDCDHPQRTGSN